MEDALRCPESMASGQPPLAVHPVTSAVLLLRVPPGWCLSHSGCVCTPAAPCSVSGSSLCDAVVHHAQEPGVVAFITAKDIPGENKVRTA